MLLFGADGGGRVFGFDQRPAPWTVIGVEQIGMSLDSLRPLGSSFTEFWELMRRGED